MDINEEQSFASDGAGTWAELNRNTALYNATSGKFFLAKKNKNLDSKSKSEQEKVLHVSMADIPAKDDLNLMDVSIFGLSSRPRFTPIEHNLKDAKITVIGSQKYGLATIHDYDLVIFMISHLVRQMNGLKYMLDKGDENPRLPPRIMRVNVSDLFRQLQIPSGGSQQKALKSKLQRLKGTIIEIDKKHDKSTRRFGSFSLIGDFTIISETAKGNISIFEIEIPRWIYDGVVRKTEPTVLTLCDDYMHIKNGYHKWLARMARKSAGKRSWTWSIEQLYQRSGTTQSLNDFQRDIKKSIDTLAKNPIKEYEISYQWILQHGEKDLKITFRYRD